MFTAEQILEHFKIYVPISSPLVPNAPAIPEEPDTPTERPDYSALKQDWDADGELKILTIGNSFSDDSMEYVYQVAQSAGITKVTLGNLYIGGCSLSTHLSNAQSNSGAYTYRTNTTGTWSSKGGVSIKTAVESDDWDFISFQQVSGYSGIANSYEPLDALIDIVEPLNPSARLVWHMTWAYQSNSGHSDFAKYDNNQMTMYNSIIGAVQQNIVTNDRIEKIIPAGTSIQNVRTSYVGDTLTRDGYHLTLDYGRLIGSLSFVRALTGVSIDGVTYMPSGVDASELAVAIEAVNNAYAKPFEVTASTYTTAPEVGGGDQGGDNEGDLNIPEGYVQLSATDMGLMLNSYHNSTGASSTNGTDGFSKGFVASKRFTKDELPVGTIIEIADGWQYRPEGWIDGKGGSRPGNTTESRIVVDDAWWGNWTERAFNISKVTHSTSNNQINTLSTDEIATQVFRIYVPNSAVTPDEPADDTVYILSEDCDSEIVTIDGKQYRALSSSAMGYQRRAYYYSTSGLANCTEIYSTTDGTSEKFWATKHFDKTNLPMGAVIWVNSGWQYRPEGWINGKAGNRPGNITTTYVTVDDSWWGLWTLRGINISKVNGAKIGTDASVTEQTIHDNFKIYIPVESIKD